MLELANRKLKKMFNIFLNDIIFSETFNCRCYCQCAAVQEPDGYLFTCRTNNYMELPNWLSELKLEQVR